MKRILAYVAIGLCAVGTLCAETASPQEAQDVVTAHIDSDGVQRVRIVGGDYFFKPRQVVVKANVPVALEVVKEAGIAPHTFVIDAPSAGIVVDQTLGTEPRTIAFTPTIPGRYPFYCRNRLLLFKSHRDRGMEGVLEVVP